MFLLSIGVTAATSAADATIPKKILGLGTAIIISTKEIDDIMKIVQSLEESGLLIKSFSETIKNEAKEQKGWIYWYVVSSIAANFLGNMLADKGVI